MINITHTNKHLVILIIGCVQLSDQLNIFQRSTYIYYNTEQWHATWCMYRVAHTQ